MRHSFTNAADVIHLFAQQSQDEAHSSNVFFNKTKIYSYGHHYLLGEFITNKAGTNAIMINDSGYSVTTSKHIWELRSATRQYKQFFKQSTDPKSVLYTLESLLKSLGTARKPEKYILPAQQLIEDFNKFNEWSGLKHSIELKETFKQIKVIAKLFDNSSAGVNVLEYAKNKAAAEKKAAAAAQKKALKNFFEFKTSFVRGEEDFCRINLNTNQIETSQGVKIDVKQGATLYRLIKAGKDISGLTIGDRNQYTVISLNGVLKVGCHHINRKNMEMIGEQLLTLKF